MKIPIKKIFVFLVFDLLVILAVHTFLLYLNYYQALDLPDSLDIFFNIDYEGNLPTWFSSTLLLSVGFTSLSVAFLSNNRNIPATFWYIHSFAYIFLSLDEVAQIHELIDNLTSIKWVIVYAPFVLIFGFYSLSYLVNKKHETPKIRFLILLGLSIYITGALIAEYLGYKYDLTSLGKQIELFIEESFEMFGAILVLVGALTKLNDILADWNNRLKS